MGKLTQLLRQYQNQLLFIVLQLIAFYWLIQTNNFQRASFFNASNIIVAKLNEKTSNVTDYTNLRKENSSLHNQLVRYKNFDSIFYETKDQPLDFIEMDTLLFTKKWKFYPAKIVNKSVRLIDNYLTINRGENGGVFRDMGVIDGNNVVGIVKQTSSEYAIVIPLINSQLSLGAKLKKTNHTGRIRWNKQNLKVSILEDIPAYAQIDIGDTVVTTGYSSYFPDGLNIGKIVQIDLSPAANAYEIKIELFTDYNSLVSTEVVSNLLLEEQKELESEVY